ncbi:hypothetical protein GCM10027187_35400 [Streptosporangium sandarakinum]
MEPAKSTGGRFRSSVGPDTGRRDTKVQHFSAITVSDKQREQEVIRSRASGEADTVERNTGDVMPPLFPRLPDLSTHLGKAIFRYVSQVIPSPDNDSVFGAPVGGIKAMIDRKTKLVKIKPGLRIDSRNRLLDKLFHPA